MHPNPKCGSLFIDRRIAAHSKIQRATNLQQKYFFASVLLGAVKKFLMYSTAASSNRSCKPSHTESERFKSHNHHDNNKTVK